MLSAGEGVVYAGTGKGLCAFEARTGIIEDSEKGIAAGVAAGVEVWAIKDNRFGMDQGAAKGLLDNLVGVLDLLK